MRGNFVSCNCDSDMFGHNRQQMELIESSKGAESLPVRLKSWAVLVLKMFWSSVT